MKKLFLSFLFLICVCTNVHAADVWKKCADAIVQDGRFATSVEPFLEDLSVLEKDNAKNKLREQLASLMFDPNNGLCAKDIVEIAQLTSPRLSLTINDKKYTFVIDIDKLFDFAQIQSTVMLYNSPRLSTFDEIENSSITSRYWSKECSAHWISGHRDLSSAVNTAAGSTFGTGKGDQYFIDFPKGDNQRAFPGFVICDKGWSTDENIMIMTHLPTALKKAKQFAQGLQGSACSNQNLSVYLVSLAGTKHSSGGNGKDAAGWVGVAAVPVLFTAFAIKGMITAGAFTVASTATTIPVAGWIVAGVAATVGAAVALWPSAITKDLKQVYVLDGPYIIR